LYLGAGFYETVTAVAESPDDPEHLIIAAGIHGEIYESPNGGETWRSIGNPVRESGAAGETDGEFVRTLSFSLLKSTNTWVPLANVKNKGFVYSGDSWRPLPGDTAFAGPTAISTARSGRLEAAKNRTGIYVNPAWASGESLEQHLKLLAEHGMDSIVVDMKDDFGRVTFDAKSEAVREVGSARAIFDIDELLTKADDAGLYVVGRIVVFQDPKLYAYGENAYSVWDKEADKPWANMIHVSGSEEDGTAVYEQREYWVDPYSEFVWRYNIAIAEELSARGVDEIQFDYIRFPSDGDTSRIRYRYRRDGMSREEAIESFLILARQKIEVPISTDLYGFNAWYTMGGWIGQNIDMIADYVDVVCPMFYPSHFPRSFLSDLDYFDRAKAIYLAGSNRAAFFVGNRSIVRPYIQAFLIGVERKYETEEYAAYLARQLDGTIASKAQGFTLWNASNIYYMISESLLPYTEVYGSKDSTLTD
jgi:hypothetical protein